MSFKRQAATQEKNDAKKIKVNGSITSFFTKPKATVMSTTDNSGSSGPTMPNFNKDKWVKSLTDEQEKLLRLEIDSLDESWLKELKDDLIKPSFLELKRFLKTERESGKTVFPLERDIYSWSRYTPLSTVRAVILGQDPYHNFAQAHGLSFSVMPPTPPPASLRNIFIALRNDYPDHFQVPPNNTGQLTPWARQGVLMLNTCLTVRAHEPNSHAGRGWEIFTQRVVDIVAKKRTSGVVFLAWGTPARKRVDKVDKERHLVLFSVHPSPLSAQRGWFNCGHFRKTNEWLVNRHGSGAEIDWNLGEKKTENGGEKKEQGTKNNKLNTDDTKNENENVYATSSDKNCSPLIENQKN